jgi:hypothetical protein
MTVSLVPRTVDSDVYLVLDQLSTKDRVWREIDEELATEAAIINWIADGQFNHPVQIVAFNTSENWSRDVTANIALKLLDMSNEGRFLGGAARELVERITGHAPTLIA